MGRLSLKKTMIGVKRRKYLIKKFLAIFLLIIIQVFLGSRQLILGEEKCRPIFQEKSLPHPLIVKDSLKREVVVPWRVKRILSLQPEVSRLIVALGAGDRLVGLDRFLRFEDHLFSLIYPPAETLPLVAMNDESINAETILRFQPDILFVSPSEPSLAENLARKLSIPVIALASMGQFELLLEEMALVGRVIDREERARQLMAYFREKLAWLGELLKAYTHRPKPRVYLAFWSSLVMTPVNYDPVKVAGGHNLAEGLLPSFLGTARTVVSLEQILQWNPEIILLHGNYPPSERQVTVEKILADKRLISLEAVRHRRVFYTFGFWYWWDPAEALFESFYLASLFYPEIQSQLNLKKLGEEIFSQFYGVPEAFTRLLTILKLELPQGPQTKESRNELSSNFEAQPNNSSDPDSLRRKMLLKEEK